MSQNNSISWNAMTFAKMVHVQQRRKYTGEPYFKHLAEVVALCSTVSFLEESVTQEEIFAVAWLHDCIEDQNVTTETLLEMFGQTITNGVLLLSDLEEGNRKTRKALARERLANAPGWVQTIKCADLISNTSSIMLHDPKFGKVYLEEKRLLLEVLTKADSNLHYMAATEHLLYQPAHPTSDLKGVLFDIETICKDPKDADSVLMGEFCRRSDEELRKFTKELDITRNRAIISLLNQ